MWQGELLQYDLHQILPFAYNQVNARIIHGHLVDGTIYGEVSEKFIITN
jgi:hypothetical protein